MQKFTSMREMKIWIGMILVQPRNIGPEHINKNALWPVMKRFIMEIKVKHFSDPIIALVWWFDRK